MHLNAAAPPPSRCSRDPTRPIRESRCYTVGLLNNLSRSLTPLPHRLAAIFPGMQRNDVKALTPSLIAICGAKLVNRVESELKRVRDVVRSLQLRPNRCGTQAATAQFHQPPTELLSNMELPRQRPKNMTR